MFNEWFTLWIQDKESMIATMQANMNADLAAGYNPAGASIIKQRAALIEYVREFNRELIHLQDIVLAYSDGVTRVNRWCYLDLKRRGAIE